MIAAVVPAAGRSTRMGRPKLVLPIGGVPLIVRVVNALRAGGADRVVVVISPEDATPLAELAESAGAEVVRPERPPEDMRASIEFGLDRLADSEPPEGVLIVPGDSPAISAELVARAVVHAAEHPDRIILPAFEGRGGHPLLLPWRFATQITHLPVGVGVNALLSAHEDDVCRLIVANPGAVADLDTPEDYRRWCDKA